MVFDLAASMGTFKALFDAAKGLKDISDAAKRNTAIVELQEKILSAQSQQTALIERVGQLEKELAHFNEWDREKERYVLKDFGCGTFTYALRSGMEAGEPYHRICASCYQLGRKSILQSLGIFAGNREKVSCSACHQETLLGCPNYKQRGASNDYDPF